MPRYDETQEDFVQEGIDDAVNEALGEMADQQEAMRGFLDFSELQAEESASFAAASEPGDDDDEQRPETDFARQDLEPDASFLRGQGRTPGARKYERKIRKPLQKAFLMTAQNPRSIADAATLLLYGPGFARAVGDLADQNAKVANVVDFVTDTTVNPWASFAFSFAPLAFQMIRNHEPVAETVPRGVMIPFTKTKKRPDGLRLKIRFRLKLGRWRAITREPEGMVKMAFTPAIIEQLKRQGIVPALPEDARKR